MPRLALPLLIAGAFTVLAALGWWWITYFDVIHYEYISAREAGVCLVGDSDICRLARALCRGAHPLTVVNYRAPAFWLGIVMLSSGLATLELRKG